MLETSTKNLCHDSRKPMGITEVPVRESGLLLAEGKAVGDARAGIPRTGHRRRLDSSLHGWGSARGGTVMRIVVPSTGIALPGFLHDPPSRDLRFTWRCIIILSTV